MTATVLDGRAIAASMRGALARRVTTFAATHGRHPCLAAVVVGQDPAQLAYARAKARAAERAGMGFQCFELPADAGTEAVVAQVQELNENPYCDAIMVELPLPPECDTRQVQAAIDPARDVDGVTPDSLSRLFLGLPGPRPATAQAVMALLETAEVPIAGAQAVIVGRSATVGKPAALLLLAAHATVTVCHSRTADLAAVTRQADILVAAAGSPGLITAEHVKPGAAVIDVGTTAVASGNKTRLVGDVDYPAVLEVAGVITPVPGGVGPVTTAIALATAVSLAEARAAGDGRDAPPTESTAVDS